MKETVEQLKKQYLGSKRDNSLSANKRQEIATLYFGAIIAERGILNLKQSQNNVEKSKGTPNQTFNEEFYALSKQTADELVALNIMEFNHRDMIYTFLSDEIRDNYIEVLKKEAKSISSSATVVTGKNSTLVTFKNEQLKTKLNQRYGEIKPLLQSKEGIKSFLYTSGKMLNFSFNNKLMAHVQATQKGMQIQAIQSLDFWKSKKTYIQKGEKGIDLISPFKFQLFELKNGKPKLDKNKKKIPQLDENGNYKYGIKFLLKKSFDISQVNLDKETEKEYLQIEDKAVILRDLLYSISHSQMNDYIEPRQYETPEEGIKDIFIQISNQFAKDENEKETLKYIFQVYSNIEIPNNVDFDPKDEELLVKLKSIMEESSIISKSLHLENIFFKKEKSIYEIKGKEDYHAHGSDSVDYAFARQKAKEISNTRASEQYISAFKEESKEIKDAPSSLLKKDDIPIGSRVMYQDKEYIVDAFSPDSTTESTVSLKLPFKMEFIAIGIDKIEKVLYKAGETSLLNDKDGNLNREYITPIDSKVLPIKDEIDFDVIQEKYEEYNKIYQSQNYFLDKTLDKSKPYLSDFEFNEYKKLETELHNYKNKTQEKQDADTNRRDDATGVHSRSDTGQSETIPNRSQKIFDEGTHQEKRSGELQRSTSQGNASTDDNSDEQRELSGERSVGDSNTEISQSREQGLEKNKEVLNYLNDKEYNSVLFELNPSVQNIIARFGDTALNNFDNIQNKQYLDEALKNPDDFRIIEVQNYSGTAPHFILIKNEYDYLYESKNGESYIKLEKLDTPLTSMEAWTIKEKYPEYMKTNFGDYYVHNRQLAEYKKYPVLENRNEDLYQAIADNKVIITQVEEKADKIPSKNLSLYLKEEQYLIAIDKEKDTELIKEYADDIDFKRLIPSNQFNFQDKKIIRINDHLRVIEPEELEQLSNRLEIEDRVDYPLKISEILTPKQVFKVNKEIGTSALTYELDDIDFKPVAGHFFASGMDIYITEGDKSAFSYNDYDKKYDHHQQMFGYTKIEGYEDGEWGYQDLNEIIKSNFEMDLYWDENKVIYKDGSLHDLNNDDTIKMILGISSTIMVDTTLLHEAKEKIIELYTRKGASPIPYSEYKNWIKTFKEMYADKLLATSTSQNKVVTEEIESTDLLYRNERSIAVENALLPELLKINDLEDTKENRDSLYSELDFEFDKIKVDESYYIQGMSVMGVKDTLQPINEYIAEIKKTDTYRSIFGDDRSDAQIQFDDGIIAGKIHRDAETVAKYIHELDFDEYNYDTFVKMALKKDINGNYDYFTSTDEGIAKIEKTLMVDFKDRLVKLRNRIDIDMNSGDGIPNLSYDLVTSDYELKILNPDGVDKYDVNLVDNDAIGYLKSNGNGIKFLPLVHPSKINEEVLYEKILYKLNPELYGDVYNAIATPNKKKQINELLRTIKKQFIDIYPTNESTDPNYKIMIKRAMTFLSDYSEQYDNPNSEMSEAERATYIASKRVLRRVPFNEEYGAKEYKLLKELMQTHKDLISINDEYVDSNQYKTVHRFLNHYSPTILSNKEDAFYDAMAERDEDIRFLKEAFNILYKEPKKSIVKISMEMDEFGEEWIYEAENGASKPIDFDTFQDLQFYYQKYFKSEDDYPEEKLYNKSRFKIIYSDGTSINERVDVGLNENDFQPTKTDIVSYLKLHAKYLDLDGYSADVVNSESESQEVKSYVRSEQTQKELDTLSAIAHPYSVEDSEDGTFNIYDEGGNPLSNKDYKGAYKSLQELHNKNSDFNYVINEDTKELRVSNLKEHFSSDFIENEFVNKGVIWAIFTDDYMFDLKSDTHIELLDKYLKISYKEAPVFNMAEVEKDSEKQDAILTHKLFKKIVKDLSVDVPVLEVQAINAYPKGEEDFVKVLETHDTDEEIKVTKFSLFDVEFKGQDAKEFKQEILNSDAYQRYISEYLLTDEEKETLKEVAVKNQFILTFEDKSYKKAFSITREEAIGEVDSTMSYRINQNYSLNDIVEKMKRFRDKFPLSDIKSSKTENIAGGDNIDTDRLENHPSVDRFEEFLARSIEIQSMTDAVKVDEAILKLDDDFADTPLADFDPMVETQSKWDKEYDALLKYQIDLETQEVSSTDRLENRPSVDSSDYPEWIEPEEFKNLKNDTFLKERIFSKELDSTNPLFAQEIDINGYHILVATGSPLQKGDEPLKMWNFNPRREKFNKTNAIHRQGGEDTNKETNKADDFVISPTEEKVGAKTKFRNNINALEALEKLKNNEKLTKDDRFALSKYTGWGGIPQAFFKSDGTTAKGWEKEADELKSLMNEDEYQEARRSTLDSFYTPAEVTNAMWKAIDGMGFKGGNVLEPSVGIGGFIGAMPKKFKSNTKVFGVELDTNTAKIAQELYPSMKVFNLGFQDFSMGETPATLVIGNPPFGDLKIEHHDETDNSYRKLSIHNYFMAKAIDSLEVGGVVAMVVSNAFLDAKDDTTRQYIHKSANLIGAIRLPNNAFKGSAHTEVTTDIVFFRKRSPLAQAHVINDWLEVGEINGTPINKYYEKHSWNLLGEWGKFGTMYQGGTPALIEKKGQNTLELLNQAIEDLPKSLTDTDGLPTRPIFSVASGNMTKAEETLKFGNQDVKIGSLFLQEVEVDGKTEREINIRIPDLNGEPQYEKVEYTSNRKNKETGEVEVVVNQTQIDRVVGMIEIAQVANALRKAQIDDNIPSKEIEALRKELNDVYDPFVKKYGYLNGQTNKRLFSRDIDAPFLLSLEKHYEKAITADVARKTGEKPKKETATKAEIFSQRTQHPYHRPTKAENEKEALYIALGESGFVDLDYMSELLNKPVNVIENLLEDQGFIYDDPVDGWVTKEEYLSGNVKKKLTQTTNPKYIKALEAVIPKDIDPLDISVQFGVGWIPTEDMNRFFKHITANTSTCAYVPYGSTWTLQVKPTNSAEKKWATGRVGLKAILLAGLNNKQITVKDKDKIDGKIVEIVNEDETIAVNDKIEAIKAEFDKWIWEDAERRERLGALYNEKFNTHARRDYDGSHLKFIGKVDDSIFKLRPHQANAVYRSIVNQKLMLDHTVGTGKTATLICSVMEMKRMGKIKKQLIAVPNHLVGQWAKEWLELYPNANILAPEKKDFEKNNRQILFSKMTTGNYDAIIIAHSQLSKIENDPNFTVRFLNEQIQEINDGIDAMRRVEDKDTRSIKQYENKKAKLQDQMAQITSLDRDKLVTFKELGVDALAVDEAHEFKNLQYVTGLQRVGGLGNPEGSKKAFDLFLKARQLGEKTGGKNLFFLTGTPISNTIAEMYTMQRYLDYETMDELGLLHFDAWVKQYAEVVTDWELSPSGKYQMRSRLAKFKNMPELMQSYHSFADVITREQIQTKLAEIGQKLSVPDMIGGKPNNVINERSKAQADFIGVPDKNGFYPSHSLVYRSENLPKRPTKGEDNMLVIMSEARKCALDMRLIDPNAKDDPKSKVNTMLGYALEQYKTWNDFKGTQLIFCDLSTPKGNISKEKQRIEKLIEMVDNGTEKQKVEAEKELSKLSDDDLMALESKFDVYNDIKAKLIKAGIPEDEIAFIHDANTDKRKSELFEKVNGGKIRFLLGSTSKMGAGMNAQKRLVGLHHLDAPWRPSDLEQREGRIIRQGNNLYQLFEDALNYSNNKTKANKAKFTRALENVGMKIGEFQNALKKLRSKTFEVMVNRYATKATLDSRMWQTLESKAKFIEQIKLASFSDREIEDISLESNNSAEMKAISSGNPLILEEMTLKQDIKKLEALEKSHRHNQFSIEHDIQSLTSRVEKYDKKFKELSSDNEKAENILRQKDFKLVINEKEFDKREDAGVEIINVFNSIESKVSTKLGKVGNFELYIEKDTFNPVFGTVSLIGEGDIYEFRMSKNDNFGGLATKVMNLLKKPTKELRELTSDYEYAMDQLPKLKNQIMPFEKQNDLDLKKERYKAVLKQLHDKDKKKDKSEMKLKDVEDRISPKDKKAKNTSKPKPKSRKEKQNDIVQKSVNKNENVCYPFDRIDFHKTNPDDSVTLKVKLLNAGENDTVLLKFVTMKRAEEYIAKTYDSKIIELHPTQDIKRFSEKEKEAPKSTTEFTYKPKRIRQG